MPSNAEGLQGQGMCLALGQRSTVLGTSSTAEGDGSSLFQTTWVLQMRAAAHSVAGAQGLEGMCGQCFNPVHPEALLPTEPSPGLPPGPVLPWEGPHRPHDAVVRSIPSVKLCPAGGAPTPTPATFLQSLTLPHPHWSQAPSNSKTMPDPFLAPSLASAVEHDS